MTDAVVTISNLPSDASKYIQEALVLIGKENEYKPGTTDSQSKRYEEIFKRACDYVIQGAWTENNITEIELPDVAGGYGPVPGDFICTENGNYMLHTIEIKGVPTLCAKAGAYPKFRYIGMPILVQCLETYQKEAIRFRFLAFCSMSDPYFMAIRPQIQQEANASMARASNEASLKRNAYNKSMQYPYWNFGYNPFPYRP